MNRTIPQRIVDQAMEADPLSASAEFLAQFRSDLQSFVSREAVQACVSERIIERFPEPGIAYYAACDPSGGSADEMTLAVGHNDYAKQTIVIDCLRWSKPPFSPERVVQEFAQTLKSYHVTTVVGDRYAGEWPREQFSKFGIKYEPSSKAKSDLYVDLLPLINSARISLLDIPKALNQLCALERRTARGGRDSIDHPSGQNQHDDLINAIAGVASLAASKQIDTSMSWVSGTPSSIDPAEEARAWRAQALLRHITGGFPL